MPSKHDYHWTFGRSVHIHFPGGGDPADLSQQGFTTREGSATISDNNGALLLYTEGTRLFEPGHSTVATAPPGLSLGGHTASCHSAIIVPPVGGGARYHIFGVRAWGTSAPASAPLTYTAVTVGGPAPVYAAQPAPMAFGPGVAAERLAAISHASCDKYWVVSLNIDNGVGQFHSLLIDSDAGPSAAPSHWKTSPYPAGWPAWHEQYMKFSPDGSLLALVSAATIDILTFDRATGLVTGAYARVTGLTASQAGYGLEFSPNGKYLYFTGRAAGYVRRYALPAVASPSTPTALGSTDLIATLPPVPAADRAGALQRAPNGKIYGVKPSQNSLFEIATPDAATATAGAVGFNLNAVAQGGGTLTFNQALCGLGLPTFTRIADDCADDRCATIAAEVDEQIAGQELHNSMRPCRGEQVEPQCHPLDIPPIAPQTYIRWGSGPCDCIEGDDTEVMHLTVCNPYKNLTLSNLTIHQLVVVDANGNPVPNLPDGSPSIQLVPVGPHCFDDIAPCTCVSREFVLRLRGAPGGPYKILVRGICFDACLHGDTEACFTFEVCQD